MVDGAVACAMVRVVVESVELVVGVIVELPETV